MGSLSHEQKQLLFDHSMGLASEQQDAQAEMLIASDPDAASFYYEQLKVLLSPLESLECEPCPDFLAEQTVRMLTERAHPHAEPQATQPEEKPSVGAAPVAVQQDMGPAPVRLSAWRSPVQIAAVAAILLFLVSVAVPSLGMVRERARQSQCQARLGRVFQGLTTYVSDHNNRIPNVQTVSGAPWWKVGDQGSENHSNTRVVWLLAKEGYVEPKNFLCPSKKTKRKLDLAALRAQALQDFPSSEYIDFSFRVCCDKTRNDTTGKTVLMADQNPLAESMPSDFSKPFAIRLDENILNRNSVNHNRRGQNVLLNDGSIVFTRTRSVGSGNGDDFFMLQEMTLGAEIKGCEVPACATDAFLAP